MPEVTYEIRQQIAVLSDRGKGWKKELNLVSWNGGMPKLDLREWNQDHSGMKKGITLTRHEFKILAEAIKDFDAELIAEGNYVRSDDRGTEEKTAAKNEKPDC